MTKIEDSTIKKRSSRKSSDENSLRGRPDENKRSLFTIKTTCHTIDHSSNQTSKVHQKIISRDCLE